MAPSDTFPNDAIYRICAGESDTWDVFQDSVSTPLASFRDKHSALTYAMCLARGELSWELLMDNHVGRAASVDNEFVGFPRPS